MFCFGLFVTRKVNLSKQFFWKFSLFTLQLQSKKSSRDLPETEIKSFSFLRRDKLYICTSVLQTACVTFLSSVALLSSLPCFFRLKNSRPGSFQSCDLANRWGAQWLQTLFKSTYSIGSSLIIHTCGPPAYVSLRIVIITVIDVIIVQLHTQAWRGKMPLLLNCIFVWINKLLKSKLKKTTLSFMLAELEINCRK